MNNKNKSQEDKIRDNNIGQIKRPESKKDAIKSGDKKQNTIHDMPQDEQMYNSFEDLREQKDPD